MAASPPPNQQKPPAPDYQIPALTDLTLHPVPTDPPPVWSEVGLLAAMQIGMSLLMHLISRLLATEESAPSAGLFAAFLGAQLFGSYYARRLPARLTPAFTRGITWRAVLIHVLLAALLLAYLLSAGGLPPEFQVPRGAIIAAVPLMGAFLYALTFWGIRFGAFMVTRFGPR